MNLPTFVQIKLTDFQNNNRYNELKKALEITAFREKDGQNGNKLYPLSMTPNSMSNSNINKVDSSIVLPARSNIKNNFKPIDMSNIKQLNEETDSQGDYLLMSPPDIDHVLFALKKGNRISMCITREVLQSNI